MKKTELLQRFKSISESYTKEPGYRYEPKEPGFIKKTQDGFVFKITFNILNRFNKVSGHHIEPNLVLYYEPVDCIYDKISFQYKEFENTVPVFYIVLGRLIANPDLIFNVKNSEYAIKIFESDDFEKEAQKIEDLYLKYAFPLFEKYSNLDNLYEVLSMDPFKMSVLQPSINIRILKSIILARQLNKPDWQLLFSKYEPIFYQLGKGESPQEKELYALKKELLGD